MNLQETAPTRIPGVSAIHVGEAEPREAARLFAEPRAVLNEAGLNIAADAAVRIHADGDDLPGRRVRIIVIITIWDDGSVTINIIVELA
jgi:hypothetical protein